MSIEVSIPAVLISTGILLLIILITHLVHTRKEKRDGKLKRD
jgi:hypothetical protein